ncbi:MAG: hypothetical protein JWR35_163 [Marmoricola sp.]|nr:hypothetical protein [Marmoricola sp.]
MKTFALLASLALIVGCGSSPTTQAVHTSTGAFVLTTLRETCPQLEAALPSGFPTDQETLNFTRRLVALSTAGDTETRNAIRLLGDAVAGLVEAPDSGLGYIEANQKYLSAIGDFAGRCKTVGSSALQ